jgi:hypothetical protein
LLWSHTLFPVFPTAHTGGTIGFDFSGMWI